MTPSSRHYIFTQPKHQGSVDELRLLLIITNPRVQTTLTVDDLVRLETAWNVWLRVKMMKSIQIPESKRKKYHLRWR